MEDLKEVLELACQRRTKKEYKKMLKLSLSFDFLYITVSAKARTIALPHIQRF